MKTEKGPNSYLYAQTEMAQAFWRSASCCSVGVASPQLHLEHTEEQCAGVFAQPSHTVVLALTPGRQ